MEGIGTDGDFDVACREIATLTERMLGCARAQEWDEIGAMERDRRRLLENLIEGDGARPDAERARRLAEIIHGVLERDRELIRLVEAGRAEAVDALGSIREGKRARNAYRSP